MPIFASVTAHAVIDILALLMWHRIFLARVRNDGSHLRHLKMLVDFYLRQCEPGALALVNPSFLRRPEITMLDNFFPNDLA